jgi:hypothetical protein
MPTNSTLTIDFWGVQVETGNVSTSFQTATGTLQGETAACMRYYFRVAANSVYDRLTVYGNATSADAALINVQHPVPMRTDPSAIEYGGALAVYDGVSVTGSLSNLQMDSKNSLITTIRPSKTASFTTYRPYCLIDDNAGTAYFALSAEL